MSVEIIIPALRQGTVERLALSLAKQSQPPDIVTIVSNEVQPFDDPGVPTRLLRFESDDYSIGECDVALRQNVGLYDSEADVFIIQGDDQVAPPSMVEDSLTVLGDKPYIWGNHRLADFTGKTLDEIRLTPREEGVSREIPTPPALHGHWSCYGGMFVARTDFITEFGGFDMAFNGQHGSEDQALGYRLMRRQGASAVWIEEPPFSWHSLELKDGVDRTREAWLPTIRNGCEPADHDLHPVDLDGNTFLACSRCKLLRFSHGDLFRDTPLIRYRSELVRTTSVWLSQSKETPWQEPSPSPRRQARSPRR